MGWLVKLYKNLNNDYPLFIYLYQRMEKECLNKHDITVLVKSQQDLKFMEHRVDLYSEFIRGQQLQKQQLEQEINYLHQKRANYDKINFHKKECSF